jgi:putative alpha-1,2-mannosidase
MSAWYVLATSGFSPVARASGVYAIGSPLFDEVVFTTSRGTRFTVQAAHNSAENLYVRSARLNGRPLERARITHEEIVSGGRLSLGPPAAVLDGGAWRGSLPHALFGSDPITARRGGRG